MKRMNIRWFSARMNAKSPKTVALQNVTVHSKKMRDVTAKLIRRITYNL
jgi:hypothetical protein